MSATSMIRAILFFVAAMVSGPASIASDRNGNWWLAKTYLERVNYVMGFVDGGRFEVDRALPSPLGTPYPKECARACMNLRMDSDWTDWRSPTHSRNEDIAHVTPEQLVAATNALYADYKNRSIFVADILGVALWNIQGVRADTIVRRLTHLRGEK